MVTPALPTLPRTGRPLRPFEEPGKHLDAVRTTYWLVYEYCEHRGIGRGEVERSRLARRATRVMFVMQAAELEVRDVSRELELSLRTVERALEHLHRACERILDGGADSPRPRPIPRPRERLCDRSRVRSVRPAA